MRCKKFDLTPMGVLFEGGGLYAIRKFYMGANSRRTGGGGVIRGFTVIYNRNKNKYKYT